MSRDRCSLGHVGRPSSTRFGRRAATCSASSAARAGLVREVPAARRAPGAAEDRAGLVRARAPAGRLLHKRLAEDWLRDMLEQARRGTLPGMVRTGATFADAAAEFLRYAEHDRALKPSTLRGYRSIVDAHLLPAFGERRLEDITTAEVERWRSTLARSDRTTSDGAHAGQQHEEPDLVLLHGVFARACKVYGLPVNPVGGGRAPPGAAGGRHRGVQPGGGVGARARRGLRAGRRDLPHGGVHRAAPRRAARAALARRRLRRLGRPRARELRRRRADDAEVRARCARCRWRRRSPRRWRGSRQREWFTGDDDLVFAGEAGGYLDGSALRRRYSERARSAPGCARCASTTCATRSARA